MNKQKKQRINIIFILIVLFVIILGALDRWQIESWYNVEQYDKWDVYEADNAPAHYFMWLLVFVFGSLIYYLFTKDLSETIGIFIASYIILSFGLLDISFYWSTLRSVDPTLCWLNTNGSPITLFSTLFKHKCVTAIDLYISTIFSFFAGYFVLLGFEKWK